MKKITILLVASLFALPAFGWWSEEWGYRKQITLDTTVAGVNLAAPLTDGVVLVRLHLGNFGYFGDTLPNGEDLRFVDADDLTPLPFHIESYDTTSQMAFVWVRLPQVQPQSSVQSFYMYYGNAAAPGGGNSTQTYDKDQSLVLHFSTGAATPRDQTAYGNQPIEFAATSDPAALIGAGARFDGSGTVHLNAAPSMNVQSDEGWTFSTWIRLEAPQANGVVVEVEDAINGWLRLGIDGNTPVLEVSTGAEAEPVRVTSTAGLSLDTWHHVAAVLTGAKVSLYVDGAAVGEGAVPPLQLAGDYMLGGASDGSMRLVSAVLDEVQVSSVGRSADAIGFAARSEGMSGALLAYGEDSQREGGHAESYFLITLRNVTADGWVVIGICGIMALVSWYVMAVKGLIIRRIRKDNALFVKAFYEAENITDLYHAESAEEKEESDNPLLGAVTGDHTGYKSSSLYHLYRAGMRDVRGRLIGASVGAARVDFLSLEALNSIRAALDAANVRETQRLNNQMVLLTLAVSGGPFLGLLGTVVGVMITFAAIAASGDVNVNAIAPGIAAALVATVAGLVVAIPALFGYNYLGNRIKEISADNRVFLDEYLASLAESHARP